MLGLGDVLRASFACPDVPTLLDVWRRVEAGLGIRATGRLKNKFKDAAAAAGGGAISTCLHANALFPGVVDAATGRVECDALVVEVQFHLSGILRCVREEHKLYEVQRCGSLSDLAHVPSHLRDYV